MNRDVMVDLETLDTRPTAIILSIGACLVNWATGEPSDPFYTVIDVASCREAGLTSSPDTEKWWDKQSPEARRVFTDPSVPLISGLAHFSDYLRGFGGKVCLWGNGSDFDNTILANAYASLGLDAPWPFYGNRCFRTVKSVLSDRMVAPPRAGTYHNALDDAIHQARVLLSVRNHIRQYTGHGSV